MAVSDLLLLNCLDTVNWAYGVSFKRWLQLLLVTLNTAGKIGYFGYFTKYTDAASSALNAIIFLVLMLVGSRPRAPPHTVLKWTLLVFGVVGYSSVIVGVLIESNVIQRVPLYVLFVPLVLNVLWRDRHLTPEAHGDISMDGHYLAGTCVTAWLAANAISIGLKLFPARSSFAATMKSIGLQLFGILILKVRSDV